MKLAPISRRRIRRHFALFIAACLTAAGAAAPVAGEPEAPFFRPSGSDGLPLRASGDGHFLVTADGHPFFWLADTSWQLIRKSQREDGTDQPGVEKYFIVRQLQGFNVLQTVICAPDGPTGGTPNTYGFVPFSDPECTQPRLGPGENDDYWDHVDYVLDLAARYHFRVALLPAWLNSFEDDHPWVKQPERAYRYGRFLGERYGKLPHIIWTLGGDAKTGHNVDTPSRLVMTRALAEGIADGTNAGKRGDTGGYDGRADWSSTFMTFHPPGGGRSSSDYLHNEPWLDMNLIQTTTKFEFTNFVYVARDYARTPPKPTLDSEVAYEDSITLKHAEASRYEGRRITDWEVRKAAYWAVLSGACGHTYGHRSFISWIRRGERGRFGADVPWYERLFTPGALQMGYLRRLIEAHSLLDRMPADDILDNNPPTGTAHAVAARAADGHYALVYIPNGDIVRVKLAQLAAKLTGAWFDPRTGERRPLGAIDSPATTSFTPPTSGRGNDWVLELTAAAESPDH